MIPLGEEELDLTQSFTPTLLEVAKSKSFHASDKEGSLKTAATVLRTAAVHEAT